MGRVIQPTKCRDFEHAIHTAHLYSKHDGLGYESAPMYVIARNGVYWVDSSNKTVPGERLVCHVHITERTGIQPKYGFRDALDGAINITPHPKKYLHKRIIMHEFGGGLFIPGCGFIYAIDKSRNGLIKKTESVVCRFDTIYRDELKHGNPHARWPRHEHISQYLYGLISTYNRNLGIHENQTTTDPWQIIRSINGTSIADGH